jgi:pimeloyl-ACP methyl ester carboxylesterase
VWAVTSTTWLANTMRTRGVDAALLHNGRGVAISDGTAIFEMRPSTPSRRAGLVFICGSGVAAMAYVPLLRPIAEAGYTTVIVRLPFRFALLEAHRTEAIARAHRAIASHSDVARWIVAGHSLGAALAARMAGTKPTSLAGLILIGTTHPRDQDLSSLAIPVTKIVGTEDGVAPLEDVRKNARLLPASTRWIEIAGGNHSQFGHYGHQLFDGTATVSREYQQGIVQRELIGALEELATLR